MKFRKEIVRVLIVVALVTTLWCRIHHRYTIRDWQVPTNYSGDALFMLAWSKAAQDGEFLPIIPKMNRYLGAPFVANWNDFPLSEDLIFCVTGIFGRLVGICAALNLSFLLACVLAAVTFYLVARYHRWRWEWCLAGAVIFGLSSYAYCRNVWHLPYVHYWHLPLFLLVCWWAGSKKGLTVRDRRYPFAVAIAAITGLLSVYYTNFFLQLLGLATLSQIVRRSPREKILGPASLVAISLGAFLLASLDTFIYSFQHGTNPNGFIRNYAQVEHYSLFPVQLFIPAFAHRWMFMQKLATYYSASSGHPIAEAVYLGMVGAAGLLGLLLVTLIGLLRRPVQSQVLGLQTIWMIGYGMTGGLNCLIGLWGFPLFHAMNRVSILVLALSLFFLVRTFSRLSRHWPQPVCLLSSFAIIGFAMFEQMPPGVKGSEVQKIRSQVDADRDFVQKMESQLPRGAMVFQLPVTPFPEGNPMHRMGLYESLRPYIWSRDLRFSHGTCKGRESDSWQLGLEQRPAPELVELLERYGFAAICINERAYRDRAAQLRQDFRAAGRARIFRDSSEFACVFLQPSANPRLPEVLTDFRNGWHAMESNNEGVVGVWSKGNAKIIADNQSGERTVRYLSFAMTSLRPGKIDIRVGRQALWGADLKPGKWENAQDLPLDLPPGKTVVDLVTNIPAAYVDSKDSRKVGFYMTKFQLTEKPASVSTPTAP